MRANHRLVLSGTPVQNCLDDVFGVFAFIVPSYFPDYDRFFEHFVRPITRSFGSENREVLMTGASAARASPVASERIEELNRAIAPFLLRRTKEEVQLALPEKTLSDVLCPLSDCQRAVWEMAVRVRRRLSSYLAALRPGRGAAAAPAADPRHRHAPSALLGRPRAGVRASHSSHT